MIFFFFSQKFSICSSQTTCEMWEVSAGLQPEALLFLWCTIRLLLKLSQSQCQKKFKGNGKAMKPPGLHLSRDKMPSKWDSYIPQHRQPKKESSPWVQRDGAGIGSSGQEWVQRWSDAKLKSTSEKTIFWSGTGIRWELEGKRETRRGKSRAGIDLVKVWVQEREPGSGWAKDGNKVLGWGCGGKTVISWDGGWDVKTERRNRSE